MLSPDAETSSFILRSYWRKPPKCVQGQVRSIVSTYLTTQTNVGSPEDFMFFKEKLQKLCNKNSYILHLDAPDVNIWPHLLSHSIHSYIYCGWTIRAQVVNLIVYEFSFINLKLVPQKAKKKKPFWSFQQRVKLLHSTFRSAGRRPLYNGAFRFKAWPHPLIDPKKSHLIFLKLHVFICCRQ